MTSQEELRQTVDRIRENRKRRRGNGLVDVWKHVPQPKPKEGETIEVNLEDGIGVAESFEKPVEPLGLNVYEMTEDVTGCPKCGGRTIFEQGEDGTQQHDCLSCSYAFFVVPQDVDVKPIEVDDWELNEASVLAEPQVSNMIKEEDNG